MVPGNNRSRRDAGGVVVMHLRVKYHLGIMIGTGVGKLRRLATTHGADLYEDGSRNSAVQIAEMTPEPTIGDTYGGEYGNQAVLLIRWINWHQQMLSAMASHTEPFSEMMLTVQPNAAICKMAYGIGMNSLALLQANGALP